MGRQNTILNRAEQEAKWKETLDQDLKEGTELEEGGTRRHKVAYFLHYRNQIVGCSSSLELETKLNRIRIAGYLG